MIRPNAETLVKANGAAVHRRASEDPAWKAVKRAALTEALKRSFANAKDDIFIRRAADRMFTEWNSAEDAEFDFNLLDLHLRTEFTNLFKTGQ